MRAVVVGAGAVGTRAARQLVALGPVQDLAVVDADPARGEAVVASIGPPARAVPDLAAALDGLEAGAPAAVVLALPPGRHPALAEAALAAGASVVSACDAVADVRGLLDLDGDARGRGLHVVAGAGFSPGLACVLAAFAARSFERVEEVHVAKVGTGGPACARHHHSAWRGPSLEWADGAWANRRAGSGRRLCWFPDPVRGVDCYRAALAEPLLLVAAFPGAVRVSARVGARRRDRLTARLPLLRKPPHEGDMGALRVEVRGHQGAILEERVVGAIDRPAVAAGAVSALAARWAVDSRLAGPGAGGLASLVEPGPFLSALADRGVKVAVFEGAAS